VTPEATQKLQDDTLPHRENFLSYLDHATQVLARGGIIPLAPQGMTKDTLGTSTGAVNILMRMAQRNNIHNFGFLVTALNFPEEQTENKHMHDHHVFHTTHINVGAFTTLEETLKTIGNDSRRFDEWALSQIGALMPAWYRGTPRP
jgi:hypothetical protein